MTFSACNVDPESHSKLLRARITHRFALILKSSQFSLGVVVEFGQIGKLSTLDDWGARQADRTLVARSPSSTEKK